MGKFRGYIDTSKYPPDEVRKLVEFGCKGVNMTNVTVRVTGTAKPYAGRCYGRHYIVIRVGRPKQFPTDNMTYSRRWHVVPPGEERPSDARVWSPKHGYQVKRCEIIRHPYGGKTSPLIVVNDWRECIVVVAAHEARHIQQFQRDLPKSEVDCERFALKALIRYREKGI